MEETATPILEEMVAGMEEQTVLVLTPSRLGLAFGLVIAAGIATVVGACIAFFVKVTNKGFLAGSLSLSAGVMIFISLVEIIAIKSTEGFVNAGHSDQHSMAYAYLTFFAGLFITWILDRLVHLALQKHDQRQALKHAAANGSNIAPGGSANPLRIEVALVAGKSADTHLGSMEAGHVIAEKATGKDVDDSSSESSEVELSYMLRRMSLLAALAIAIHNMPEGLAAFIGTVADPKAGAAIAFAIAMHNIPEGIVVCMPLYYATKSRLKGLMWAALSGAAEVFGAVIGYLIVKYSGTDPPLLYALVFGIVGGMMTYISLFELLPTALRYDPSQKIVMTFLVLGMAIMAASIILFEF